MERLRLFARSNRLRVAAADLAGMIPLMVVSDYLTWIAEAASGAVLDHAWRYLAARHGRPSGVEGDGNGFAVIGYGKVGGLELGYGSDLDLVFLHADTSATGTTDGDRPIANDLFYVRLGQRMIHLYTARTGSGVLYDVDMRLRPSGNAGLLVSSLQAFASYQQSDAWTWEHQALLRARPIAGDARVARSSNRSVARCCRARANRLRCATGCARCARRCARRSTARARAASTSSRGPAVSPISSSWFNTAFFGGPISTPICSTGRTTSASWQASPGTACWKGTRRSGWPTPTGRSVP